MIHHLVRHARWRIDQRLRDRREAGRKGFLHMTTTLTTASITRRLHGATEHITFEEFAQNVIQHHEIAADVARRMLDGEEPFHWNEDDDPVYFEAFTIANRDALAEQLAEHGG